MASFKNHQEDQLRKFRRYAAAGQWQNIRSDHYDWYMVFANNVNLFRFMFPIEDGSKPQFNVLEQDVEDLRSDPVASEL